MSRIALGTVALLVAFGCSRRAHDVPQPTPAPLRSVDEIGRKLGNQPVEAVPNARGGGPLSLGRVEPDAARTRMANARCRALLACGADEESLDPCIARESVQLRAGAADCAISAARLDACLRAIDARGCTPGPVPPECDAESLCVSP